MAEQNGMCFFSVADPRSDINDGVYSGSLVFLSRNEKEMRSLLDELKAHNKESAEHMRYSDDELDALDSSLKPLGWKDIISCLPDEELGLWKTRVYNARRNGVYPCIIGKR